MVKWLQNKVNLLINSADKILSQDNSGLLTTLTLDISSDGKTVYLKGKEGATISSIDTTKFVKDGMIDTVTFDTQTGILKFIFNTDAGKTQIDVPMSSLVDTYIVDTGSTSYLAINDYKISAKVDINGGLASYNSITQLNNALTTETTRATNVENSILEKINTLSGSVNTINSSITTLRNDVNTSANTLNQNINQLRLDTVSSANSLNILINSLRNDAITSATTLNNKITTNEGNITLLLNRILTLETSNSALTEEVNTLKTTVTTLTNLLNTLNSKVTQLETKIEELDSNVFNDLSTMLVGTTNEIAITSDSVNKKITIGFDNTTIVGKNSDSF